MIFALRSSVIRTHVDIPPTLGDVDMGITGEDVIAEAGVSVNVLLALGFGKCKLCVLAPKGKFASPSDIAGKRIVTSFSNLAKKYLAQYETNVNPAKIR